MQGGYQFALQLSKSFPVSSLRCLDRSNVSRCYAIRDGGAVAKSRENPDKFGRITQMRGLGCSASPPSFFDSAGQLCEGEGA